MKKFASVKKKHGTINGLTYSWTIQTKILFGFF